MALRRGWGNGLVAVCVVVVATIATACGGGGATSSGTSGSTVVSTAKGNGDGGGSASGSIAFQLASGCTQAVGDGKEFLAVGCPGSITRIDPSTGKARWTVNEPTWTKVDKLVLAGEVVVAIVKVSVPASGLTAKTEGDRVVALADGKKLWETKLSPTFDTHADATAEVVVVDYSAEPPNGKPRAGTVTTYEPQTGKVRFERPVDGAKCDSEGPMILKSSVIACRQRFGLTDGSPLTLPGSARVLAADPGSDIAIGYDSDVTFKILRSDGTQASMITGEFMGFVGGLMIVKQKSDLRGTAGKIVALGPDGAQRWEQAVTFDAQGGFFDNLSFANGTAWVRNSSDELVAIDGTSGRASSPLPARAAGLSKRAQVVASTTRVLAVRTSESEESAGSLRFIRR